MASRDKDGNEGKGALGDQESKADEIYDSESGSEIRGSQITGNPVNPESGGSGGQGGGSQGGGGQGNLQGRGN